MESFKLDGARPAKVSITRQTMEDIASLLEVELRDGEFEFDCEYQKTCEILEECRKSLEDRSSQGVVWHPFPDELPPEDGHYLITAHDYGETIENPWIEVDFFDKDAGRFLLLDWDGTNKGWCVTAWAALPAPYKP